MIEPTNTFGRVERGSLAAADPDWSCRWCGSHSGVRVLDAGLQPPSDLHPKPSDPKPDPEFPLVMVMCLDCRLVQLESDPTTPEEPRGLEPRALVEQAEAAVDQAEAAGYLRPGIRVLEYPSPHGGSWVGQLERRSLIEASQGPAELLVDIFGMMHEPDQRAALMKRLSQMSADAILLMQFHTVAAIVRSGFWNALRHGHFAYYSTPVLVRMMAELGLTALSAWEYPLYGGTILLALAKKGSRWGDPAENVTRLVDKEIAEGVLEPTAVASLNESLASSAAALGTYLTDARSRSETVAGYSAASRTSALLQRGDVSARDLVAIADAAPGLHGRAMPGSRIPIVSPAELVERKPDKVLLFVPDLLDEVRRALPGIELSGGRWVVLDPMPREIAPAATAQ
jgi:C-methyltransferase C-terminal domain/Putative zinc binding domain